MGYAAPGEKENRMLKDTTKSLVGQPNHKAKFNYFPTRPQRKARAEAIHVEKVNPPQDTAGRIHCTQERGGSEVASNDDDDPLPSQRQLYNQLLTAINSGRFTYFATFRTPRPAPKGSPRYNPKHQEQLGNEIAQSLADLGIACIVVGSFQSVNTERRNPHFHALLSAPLPFAWSKAFRDEYGRRAVHVEEIGDQAQDAAKVAYYIARQGVSLSVASEAFTRSAIIEGKGDSVSTSFALGELEAPALAMNPPQPIPIEARRRLEALGLLRPRPPPWPSDDGREALRAIDNRIAHLYVN